MWPRLLDLTQDECRGMLRRLELESYSNIVGAFRAQGTLSAAKLKILKNLRNALHISEARHKAEVRRVVNDESLSTIAKTMCGPNSEIEWNKEGSRGYTILGRNTAHTALSVTANNASAFGAQLNQKLNEPENTVREKVLCADDAEVENSSVKSLVTEDPQLVLRKLNSTSKSHRSHSVEEQHNAHRLNNHLTNNLTENRLQAPTHTTDDKFNDKLQSAKLRRKSTSLHMEIPAKTMILANRKASRIDSNVSPDEQITTSSTSEAKAPIINIKTGIAEKCEENDYINEPAHTIHSDVKTFRSNPTKATTSSTNGVDSQPSPQILKLFDGNAIVMRPSTQVVSTKPIIAKAKTSSNVYMPKAPSQGLQTFITAKSSNIEYITLQNNVRSTSNAVKASRIQTFRPDVGPGSKITNIPANNIIKLPTSAGASTSAVIRSPNILKANENPKVVHTIIANFDKHSPKPIHMKPTTVTIHPNTTFTTRAIQQIQPKKVMQTKVFYEQYNDWEDYDPNVVDGKNGYGESSSNGYYESNISNDIITADEIIAEEYITNETDLENVIEMDVDSSSYVADDIIIVESPH